MRISFFKFSIVSLLAIGIASYFWLPILWSLVLIGPLILVGIVDFYQPSQTIRRNFPVLGRMRYWMEMLRPKVYQYFIESDTDGTPFNRLNRNVIYQRSKKVNDTTPFGTQVNVYEVGYEWMNHSIVPLDAHAMDHNPKVLVGGPDCKQPYSSSLLNVSAMSFGALSQNAIMSLNAGAKLGGFAHNTGEGGLSKWN